ncbi:MAG: universal stress protein [Pseudomonadota bacterium]|nr:universal stress protein [Pseudomonadota bacterium]
MKSILLYVANDRGMEARVEAALSVAHSYKGHVNCLHVTPHDFILTGDPLGSATTMPVEPEDIRRREDELRHGIEERFGREGISWEWRALSGMPQQMIAEQSRLADLIVMNLPGAAGALADPPASMTGTVAIHARAPVLAVPVDKGHVKLVGPVLVAWNGSQECAHALRLALPMLSLASVVHIVTISDNPIDFPPAEASRYLALHDIVSQIHEWPPSGNSVADALLDAAASLQCGYILMGAYGRPRFLEAVFGGVSRDLLHGSTPLVLAH